MRLRTVLALVIALLVPLLMLHPSLVGFVAAPQLMGQRWDEGDGRWWGLMNGALALAYAAWMVRWATAAHHFWLLRLFAIALLFPGFLLASVNILDAVQRMGSPGGLNSTSNAHLRAEALGASSAFIAVALLLIILDRGVHKGRDNASAAATRRARRGS